MGLEILLLSVIVLVLLAISDLIVGVSNDAVNFLNSSLGSKVASRSVIMVIASIGILIGVTFSSGMMEVARKGIFNPGLFTMPELMTVFLAVMLSNVILLDLFNTYGLPTSTTVSIVFGLLGGAVAVSMVKIYQSSGSLVSLAHYINTSKAMIIIMGILFSIIIAFVCGAIIQFLSRLLFTFDYLKRLKRYGALWGGLALSMIVYFILIKGAKGASFMSVETVEWIKHNAFTILIMIFAVSAVLMQILLFFNLNILKLIVLVGTFALAMAFAANDLMNFIGVPMAGYHSYKLALTTGSPLTAPMTALNKSVSTETFILLIAGTIMVITLWLSKKTRSVSETELNLGQQEEGAEKFEAFFLSRIIVRMFIGSLNTIKSFIPTAVQKWIKHRLDPSHFHSNLDSDNRPSFDLLRASVNFMVASAIISYATSQKLPLSTTYVTFMVSMGTSFADQAWGRESAVYRVSGVLTVIGGWFMTAFLTFIISCIFALVIYYSKTAGMLLSVLLAIVVIWKHHHTFEERSKLSEKESVFNLKKVTDVNDTISTTFEHVGYLLKEIRESLDVTLEALFNQNEYVLRAEKNKTKKYQHWANIVVANVFKSMRLLQKERTDLTYKYGQTIRGLQKMADGHRDIVMRSYLHVCNHHKGLLDPQKDELSKVRAILNDVLRDAELTFSREHSDKVAGVVEKNKKLKELADILHRNQLSRIRTEESKTRLSILFYAIIGNAIMLSKQNIKLMKIFEESFGREDKDFDFDLD